MAPCATGDLEVRALAPPGRKVRTHCPEQPLTAGGILGSRARTEPPAHARPAAPACGQSPLPTLTLRQSPLPTPAPAAPALRTEFPRLHPGSFPGPSTGWHRPPPTQLLGLGPAGLWPHVLLGQISSESGLVSPGPQQLPLHIKPCRQPGCTVGTSCLAVFLWLCAEATSLCADPAPSGLPWSLAPQPGALT